MRVAFIMYDDSLYFAPIGLSHASLMIFFLVGKCMTTISLVEVNSKVFNFFKNNMRNCIGIDFELEEALRSMFSGISVEIDVAD